MTCPWCGVDYEGAALYHVCADGASFQDRSNRYSSYLPKEELQSISVKEPLTPYDVKLLRGMKIRW